MHDTAAKHLVESIALDPLGLNRPWMRQAPGECGFAFLGNNEAAQPAGGIRKRRLDGMQSIEPKPTGG